MKAVSNTTVLSNFAAIGQVELLHQLFGELFLPVQVHEEIQEGLEEGYSFYAGLDRLIHPLSPNGWLRLTSLTSEEEIAIFSSLPSRLHHGEAAGIAIASHRGWIFLTDDRMARKYARSRGVVVSGTLGCLIAGIRRVLWSRPEAEAWLKGMVATGYYSPVDDLGSLLEEPGED